MVAENYPPCDQRFRPLLPPEWENLENLSKFGICATAAQNHEGGRGRPTDEYWLNFNQANRVVVKSGTSRADEATICIIRVFGLVVKGESPILTMIREMREDAKAERE